MEKLFTKIGSSCLRLIPEECIAAETNRPHKQGREHVFDALIDIIYYITDTYCRHGQSMGYFAKEVQVFSDAVNGPPTPSPISDAANQFLARMVFSECCEGLGAVGKTVEWKAADKVLCWEQIYMECYNALGIFAKPCFDEVHAANLRKGTMVDGKFTLQFQMIGGVKKVIKPEGWVGPDIEKVIKEVESQ